MWRLAVSQHWFSAGCRTDDKPLSEQLFSHHFYSVQSRVRFCVIHALKFTMTPKTESRGSKMTPCHFCGNLKCLVPTSKTMIFSWYWLSRVENIYDIHNPSYYHHQIGSIHLSHCCHIFPWLCVWDGCTIIFCHLLHIYPGNTGTLFPLLMFSLWYLQMIGYIMACRSCSFVCRLHHLIIIIMQTYLKALNY